MDRKFVGIGGREVFNDSETKASVVVDNSRIGRPGIHPYRGKPTTFAVLYRPIQYHAKKALPLKIQICHDAVKVECIVLIEMPPNDLVGITHAEDDRDLVVDHSLVLSAVFDVPDDGIAIIIPPGRITMLLLVLRRPIEQTEDEIQVAFGCIYYYHGSAKIENGPLSQTVFTGLGLGINISEGTTIRGILPAASPDYQPKALVYRQNRG